MYIYLWVLCSTIHTQMCSYMSLYIFEFAAHEHWCFITTLLLVYRWPLAIQRYLKGRFLPIVIGYNHSAHLAVATLHAMCGNAWAMRYCGEPQWRIPAGRVLGCTSTALSRRIVAQTGSAACSLHSFTYNIIMSVQGRILTRPGTQLHGPRHGGVAVQWQSTIIMGGTISLLRVHTTKQRRALRVYDDMAAF